MNELNLEERISQIEQRNKVVEEDKTWETSYTRVWEKYTYKNNFLFTLS